MAVHTQPVTSICSLQGGHVMLTSGLVDVSEEYASVREI